MTTLRIPIRNDIPAYSQITELDGVAYNMVFRFNRRSNRWYLDLLNESGDELIEGIKLLIDTDLNTRFKSLELPKGLFVCSDESGRQQQPDRLNFSNDVRLFYIDEEDLNSITGN